LKNASLFFCVEKRLFFFGANGGVNVRCPRVDSEEEKMKLFALALLVATATTVSESFVLPTTTTLTPTTLHGKRPKTASEWGAYRRATVIKKEGNTTNYAKLEHNITKGRYDWEQRVQFESLQNGNKHIQHDILKRHLF